MLAINSHNITPELITQLTFIHQECFENPWYEKDFINLLNNSCVHGLLSAYGFILYTLIENEAEILTICVKKQERQKGHATELLSFLLKKHPELKKIFLEVNQTNLPAQKLYNKFGFKQIGIRKNYYKTSEGLQNGLSFVLQL